MYRRFFGIIGLCIALICIAAGLLIKHKVYDKKALETNYGERTFTRISDPQLIIDATFSGTIRKNGQLYATYDRSDTRGKRTCPT